MCLKIIKFLMSLKGKFCEKTIRDLFVEYSIFFKIAKILLCGE